MTKRPSDEHAVVEMDAMDEAEWEKDVHTPIVQHDQLSKLVKASSDKEPVPERTPVQTTAATVRRTPNTVAKPTPAKPTASGSGVVAKPEEAAAPPKRRVRPSAAPPSATLTPSAAREAPAAKAHASHARTVPKPAATTAPGQPPGPPPAAAAPGPRTTAPGQPPGPMPAANQSSSRAPVPAANQSSSRVAAADQSSSRIPQPAANQSSSRLAASTLGASSSAPSPMSSASSGPTSARAASPAPSPRATNPASPPPPPAPPPTPSTASETESPTAASDAPSASVRKLPLPPPRAPRPTSSAARSMPTPPRGGNFAFAGSSDAPAKAGDDAPTVVAPPVIIDDDLEIPAAHRTPTSEAAVLAKPLDITSETVRSDGSEATVATPPPIREDNPFDDAVWRREGGRDSDADVGEVAGAHPIVGGNPLREAIAAFVKNKRNLAIAAGAVVLLAVLIVFATGGDKKPSAKQASAKQTTKREPAAKAAPSEPPAEPTSETGSAAVEPETPSQPSEPAVAPSETPTEPTPSEPKPTEPKPKRTSPTLGGKQVVLEYDTQAREGKPIANAGKDDQAAINKARTSYAAGNTRLFAGDADGAIKNYKQALGYYPGYVAAYRGLGLAYAQKGENANAVRALRTYVGSAPGAKDAPLIRKRIQTLK
ncbi:MAG TPA: tetratricopeptide repeat protein [Kofleriaceae bacterium]